MHEMAHVNINEYYGLENKEIKINELTGSYVKASIPKNISKEKEISYLEMTSLNEIIGYNVAILIQVIIGCTLFIVIIIN